MCDEPTSNREPFDRAHAAWLRAVADLQASHTEAGELKTDEDTGMDLMAVVDAAYGVARTRAVVHDQLLDKFAVLEHLYFEDITKGESFENFVPLMFASMKADLARLA